MTLRAADLNLLPVLRALLAEASITRAAGAVSLSQPATSHALARLRALFGDPLLVQVGRTMRLTPRGQELRARVDAVCAGIEDLLLDRAFDPRALSREFTIATPDYMALILGPALMRMLAATAPGVSVHVTDVRLDFAARLAAGDADVAVVAHVPGLMRGLETRRGFADRLVGIVAQGHPLARRGRLTAAMLARYPRLGVDPGPPAAGEGHTLANLVVGSGGPLSLGVSHLLALPFLVARTEAFAILPAALAEEAASMAPIVSFPLPGRPAPLDICMAWSPVHDADPAHAWFRSVVDAALGDRFARPSEPSKHPDSSAAGARR